MPTRQNIAAIVFCLFLASTAHAEIAGKAKTLDGGTIVIAGRAIALDAVNAPSDDARIAVPGAAAPRPHLRLPT